MFQDVLTLWRGCHNVPNPVRLTASNVTQAPGCVRRVRLVTKDMPVNSVSNKCHSIKFTLKLIAIHAMQFLVKLCLLS